MRYFLALLIVLSGCIQPIEFTSNDVPKIMVVNSILEEGKQIKVKLSYLQSILDTSNAVISNAIVAITENGYQTDTLNYRGNGYYTSSMSAKSGCVYELNISSVGYPDVNACDTLPYSTIINHATLQKGLHFNEYGDELFDYSVTITDDEGVNFYELLLIRQQEVSDTSFMIDFPAEYIIIDPVISSEGLDAFYSESLLFSDRLISDNRYSFNIQTEGHSGGYFESPVYISSKRESRAAVLRTCSKAYFEYKKSWMKHRYNRADELKVEDPVLLPLVGEPTEMYSNIKGGLGIFVAFSQSYLILE